MLRCQSVGGEVRERESCMSCNDVKVKGGQGKCTVCDFRTSAHNWVIIYMRYVFGIRFEIISDNYFSPGVHIRGPRILR